MYKSLHPRGDRNGVPSVCVGRNGETGGSLVTVAVTAWLGKSEEVVGKEE